MLQKEKLLRTNMVAEKLGVCVETVRRLIRYEKIYAINIGTGKRPDYRIPESALHKFQANNFNTTEHY